LTAPLTLLLVPAAAVFAVSCLGTRALIGLLLRRAVFDLPNERSLHVVPTPRGGGVAVIGASVLAWLALCAVRVSPPTDMVVALGGVGLAVVSWLDDLRGLSQGVRLVAQFAAVAAGMCVLPHGALFQGWLPPGLDAVAGALLWVWFVNLFNFMDGIDGIDASEAVAIALGLVLVASAGGAIDLARAAPPALGFLVWNWAPARIFLGDVGSIPLGYLLGFLLYQQALRGEWQAALILPLYFLADASLTLLRRLARGQRIWRAHREHFYQRAVQRGLSHDAVVLRVIAADIVLIACAWAAADGWGFAALGVAGLTVLVLLIELGRGLR
jgi:UDP-N-acetylmuramyl pentapeptide phosphotransferase/UDP-N-acetylglucosamine-1-phosphate transferase